MIDDLDRRRQLVQIYPDAASHLVLATAPPCARTDVDDGVGSATASRAVPILCHLVNAPIGLLAVGDEGKASPRDSLS